MAEKAILGISPGTRVVGLAVVHDGELIEWRVKSFKDAWSREKRDMILKTILQLCEYHNVRIVALKKIDPLRSSPQLDRLVWLLIRKIKQHGIRVREYSLSDLDYDKRDGARRTKDAIAQKVVERHPELRAEFHKERNNRREYHTKMFEAVAIAELAYKVLIE